MADNRPLDPLTLRLAILVTCFMCMAIARGTIVNKGPLTETEPFPHTETLDTNYSLEWKYNSSHIMFHTKVKAVGWVGLGISRHGDMFPGDMVIAWSAGETVHFHDRHATGRAMPIVDKRQDWELVRFRREANGETALTVLRQLDTCDQDEDLPILEGTTRVIYAYSHAVPSSDNAIPQHLSTTRGSKSILLLEPPTRSGYNSEMPEDFQTIDLINNNYTVPSKPTTYACVIMKIEPPSPVKHHLIRYEPVIQPGHEKLVHHISVYSCGKSLPAPLLGKPYDCFQNPPAETEGVCDTVMLAWGAGGGGISYPPHVGHSLGTPGDPVYFKLEVHYDNVNSKADYVDSSGLRWFVTKKLRQHDGGTLPVATFSDKSHIIPPRMNSFLIRAYCPPSCLEKPLEGAGSGAASNENSMALGDDEIKIFGGILHSHRLGIKMATRHVRNRTELPPIIKDDHYDFNYQETRMLTEERIVKKNDMIITDCFYDSSKRSNVTFGGFSSFDEMCTSFLFYYPRKSLDICLTRVMYNRQGQPMYPGGVVEFAQSTDWSLEMTRETFKNNTQMSDVVNTCVYGGSKQVMELRSPQPEQFKVFVPEVKMTCLAGVGMVLENPTGNCGDGSTLITSNISQKSAVVFRVFVFLIIYIVK